jgi:hypothetical protein
LSFIPSLTHEQDQVIESLKTTQQSYKERHDAYRIPLSFAPSDKVFLYMERQCFQLECYHKLKPLHYGPYTILQKIGENAYHLDFPPHLGIHDVVNVNSLNHFEPSLVEDEVTISFPSELVPNFQPPLLEDIVIDTQSNTTHIQSHTCYLVGPKGRLPSQV